jgi:hypothetical protein
VQIPLVDDIVPVENGPGFVTGDCHCDLVGYASAFADLRWQLLRRNEQYRAAYKKFSEKHPGFPAKMVDMQEDQLRRALGDDQIFRAKCGCLPADPSLYTNPFVEEVIDAELIIPIYSQKKQNLRFDIPIYMPSEAILRWVRYWVGHYKRNANKDKDITKKRLQDIRLAIKVHDLKIAGKKYIEIQDELKLDPEYLGTGVDRAKNLYNTAKTWIKRAEMKSLWAWAPWMFDTIIDRHRRGQLLNSSTGQ